MKLSLQSKFIIIAGFSALVAAANLAVTSTELSRLNELYDKQHMQTMMVQRHMEADMSHDAMRGDAQAYILALIEGNAQEAEKLKADFDEGANTMLKNTKENIDAASTEKTKAMLGELIPLIEDYTAKGHALLAGATPAEAKEKFPEFITSFKTLEEKMGAASERLETVYSGWVENAKALKQEFEQFVWGISLFSILIAIFIPFYANRGVFRPLGTMMQSMKRIAGGESKTTIPYTERSDEMGEMARTAVVFKENAQRVHDLAEEQKRRDQEAIQQRKNDMQTLANNFESSVKGVVDMVASAATEMEATSKSVAGIADTNKNKLKVLTSQIDGTSRNVQLVASSTSELSSAINEISAQVARAASITSSAVHEAEQADGTVASLTAAAQKIGEVLEMINSIAAQINLLALNATIEAARAGDAGKGFAVVASEVKNLAGQTTKATEEIAQYINSIQGATTETVGAIKNIGGKIREIDSIATSIAGAVEEQGVATKDIASNVQQAADSTNQVSKNAGDVASSSAETGESASQMMSATSELSRQSETLRREVDRFLAGVRAG